MKCKIKKHDTVVVIAGKDKGKRGKVLKVLPKDGRVVVEGVKIICRHIKPKNMQEEGRRKFTEAAIHVSNVALVDPKLDIPSKCGVKITEEGVKVRYAKKSGEIFVDKRGEQ